MNKDEWRLVEEWVYRALELSEEERRSLLQSLSDKQQALGREVIALVEAHRHIAKFLEPPLTSPLLKTQPDSKSRNQLTQKQWKNLVLGYFHEKEREV